MRYLALAAIALGIAIIAFASTDAARIVGAMTVLTNVVMLFAMAMMHPSARYESRTINVCRTGCSCPHCVDTVPMPNREN